MPDVGLYKMLGDARYDRRDPAVGDERDFFNFAVVFANELQVRDKRTKVMPPRKPVRFYEHTMQKPLAFQIGIDLSRQPGEICGFERTFRFYHQNAVVKSHVIVQHMNRG